MSHRLPSCALALCLGAFAGSASAQFVPLFAAPETYNLSIGSGTIAMGDVNADGTVDLVEVTTFFVNNGVINVLLGQGDGQFVAHSFELPVPAFGLALGDVSGDGLPDLVVAAHDPDSISVLINLGHGTFGAGIDHPIGPDPSAVVLGDFNGDGVLDVAALSSASPPVRVLLGTGGGGFGPPASYAATPVALDLRAVDVSGDGRLDLVAVGLFGGVSVLLGQAGGSFAAPVNYTLGSAPTPSLAVGDVNADGWPDLAVASDVTGAPFVGLLLGTGGGAFGPSTHLPVGGPDAASVAMADFDADGHLDLVVGNSTTTVGVLFGQGTGAFDTPMNYASVTSNAPLVIAGDLSGDGKPDIVAMSDKVSVLRNQNPNVGPWTDVGFGLPGLHGIPVLLGSGTLAGGTTAALALSNAAPVARTVLFVSVSSVPTSFKGGTLAAFPSVREFGLVSDAAGQAALSFPWPAGIPAASTFYFQWAVQDAAGPQGVTLSNALRAVTP